MRNEEFTFQSPNAEDVRELVQFFLDGLKRRSMYVVALQDYKGKLPNLRAIRSRDGRFISRFHSPTEEGGNYLQLKKGDLVVLDPESRGENILNGGWCSGKSERTGERGDFPAEVVCIFPALTKPPADIMVSRAL